MKKLGLALALAMGSMVAVAQPVYTSLDLGVGSPVAMSGDARYIVGYDTYSSAGVVVWTDGQIRSVSGPGGGSPGSVIGVDGQGTVVANYTGFSGNTQVLRYSPDGAYTAVFDNLDGTPIDQPAAKVNDAGWIVGSRHTNYHTEGFILKPDGTMVDLPNEDGFSSANALAINSVGDAVGLTRSSNSSTGIAAVWHDGVPTSLGSYFAPGTATQAVGISNNGKIIGTGFYLDDPQNRFNWMISDGVIRDLGSFVPKSINSRGEIIGSSQNYTWASADAYWSEATGVVYIHNLLAVDDPVRQSFSFSRAMAINDQGQILGESIVDGTVSHVILLSPVPEAGTRELLALGLVGLGLATARRKRISAAH